MDIDEKALADETVDVTPTVTPQNFDLDAWISGVRPTRRAVKLYPSGHLVARMEQLAEQIDDAGPDADVDALIDEFQQCRTQFQDGLWVTLEKRSSEWETDFRKRFGQQHKIDVENPTREQTVTIVLNQLVEQIVEPSGFTVDHLRSMLDRNEGELNKLVLTLTSVNGQLAETAGVLSRDFSERRSAGTRT